MTTPVPSSLVSALSARFNAMVGSELPLVLLEVVNQLALGAVLVELDDPAAHVLYANPAFAELVGRPLERLPGLLLVPEVFTADELPTLDTAALRRGEPLRAEWRHARPGASELWLELTLTPVSAAPLERRLALGFVSDVTPRRERLRAELERARLSAVELLAAGMSHEINNPLASVTTNLEWLAAAVPSQISPAGRRAARDGHAPAQISGALVDALAGAERIEAVMRYLTVLSGNEDARRDLVDVRQLLDSAVSELEALLPQDLLLSRDYEQVPPVLASEQRLRQAFVNLITNAIQAVSPDAARRAIVLRTRVHGSRVRVEVEDSGPGVAASIAPRLFSPFVTTKPIGLGKGLGLYLCRTIVAASGGETGFRPAPTTFWVDLPSK